MAIPVIITTDTTTRYVWSGDPDVSHDGPGWVLAADAPHTDGADVVEVRTLNSEQLAIVGSLTGATAIYDGCRRVVNRVRSGGKWLRGVKAERWVSGLPYTVAIGLLYVGLALTRGDDPAVGQADLYALDG